MISTNQIITNQKEAIIYIIHTSTKMTTQGIQMNLSSLRRLF